MRPITLLLALALTACSSSCGGTSKPAVNWPGVVTCTEPAHLDMLAHVQGLLITPEPEEGETTTIGDRAVAALHDLARTHGTHVVACLVDEAVRSFERGSTTTSGVIAAEPSGSAVVPAEPAPERKNLRTAQPEPTRTLPDAIATEDAALHAAARGRDFLQRVAGTRVQEAPAP